ncbi:N protein [Rhizoctonia solani rhabdovirus 1]|nr:N protein [Rhizoctonia solani rhabdovirus 1]
MADYTTLTFHNKQVTLVVDPAQQVSAPTWPKEWFDASKAKPTCHLYNSAADNATTCGGCTTMNSLDAEVVGGTLTMTAAKILFYIALTQLEATCLSDWDSFGQSIGKMGKVVHPSDILQIQTSDPTYEHATMATHKPCSVWKEKIVPLVMVYAAPYRIGNLPTLAGTKYKEALKQKIVQQVNAMKYTKLTEGRYDAYIAKTSGWIEDSDYTKAIAAMDMFITKFKNPSYDKIRVSTLTSRFKDCAALNEVLWLGNLFGMSPGQAITYVPYEQLSTQLANIFKAKNETEKPDSYMPYGNAFGLFTVSPYSARANPLVHHYINMIGACLGDKRALMSNCFDTAALKRIIEYAMFVTYIVVGSDTPDYLVYANDETRELYEGQLEAIGSDAEDDEKEGDDAKGKGKAEEKSKEKKKAQAKKTKDQLLKDEIKELKKKPEAYKVILSFRTVCERQCPAFIKLPYFRTFATFVDEDDRDCLGKHLKNMADGYLATN